MTHRHIPAPRLCHLVKSEDYEGFGFNLYQEKGKPGQYIGRIEPGSPAERAGLVSYIRLSLSVTAVRAQAKFLLDRLRLLGDGAAEADRRRARAVQLEAAAFQERRAQGAAFIQGRNVRRLGFGRPDPE